MNDTHAKTHTFGRDPLDDGSARRKDLTLTTHNTHERQKTILPAKYEPTILGSIPSQT